MMADANLIAGIATKGSRLEILDWYHLVENLYKVGGDKNRLAKVEAFLWRGNVVAAIAEFDQLSHPQVDNFIAYLRSSSLSQNLITGIFRPNRSVRLVGVQLSLLSNRLVGV